jgi:hypothetical protein
MIGSIAGFLVLHRWRLAGTITGAAAMPLIYTVASHCSHASLEGMRRWVRCRVRKSADPECTEPAAIAAEPETAGVADTPAPRSLRPGGRVLQWSAATLALLAFTASVYSLTHLDAGTTILRERVVETVTVTVDGPPVSVAKSNAADTAAAGLQDASTTTTTAADPITTVTTVAGSGGSTTTTLP